MILTTPEVRKIKTKTGEKEFNVVKVEQAIDWPTADKFEIDYTMSQPSGNIKMQIALRGLSLSAWEKIEVEHFIPEIDEDAPEDTRETLLEMRQDAENKKVVALFEEAIGKKIPGESFTEKINFINQRNAGEIDALKFFIRTRASGFTDGPLLNEYLVATNDSQQEVIKFSDFNDWRIATESKYVCRIHRPFEDYIVEFPLRGITQEKKLEIDERTKEPKPPMVPGRDKNNPRKFDRNRMVPNRNDPSYLQQIRAVNQLRTALFFNECLMFKIPGANEQEQYNWIASHLIGDVMKVKGFIDQELANYHGYYDFFSNT